MYKYSLIKKELDIKVEKTDDNILAYLTHYLHTNTNGVSQHFKKPAHEYLNKISLLKERSITVDDFLPIKFDVPFPPPQKAEFSFIDLFAGIGGFRIALQENKGKCVFSCEYNFQAQRSYESNFGEIPFGDITKLDINTVPKHDVLAAGFPCQPFSISGKMKGFNDERGTLIYNVFKIIEERSPKVVFLENVKHLIHHDGGNTLRQILTHLEKLDYKVSWDLLNASDFGVPQNRERVIIVGHKTKRFDFSKIKKKPKVTLKEFLDKKANFEYMNTPYTILDNFTIQDSGLIFIGYRNATIRKAGVRPGTDHLSRVHKQPNRIYSTKGLHPALPSQESAGRFWIYDKGKVRKLTIDECYRIMGFPDKFKKIEIVGELYKQIGNSVCVPMIKEIARQIKSQLL